MEGLRASGMTLRAAQPEDAWERQVALPWLIRRSFEVPADIVAALPAEERDFIMEAQVWYEQFNARRLKEAKESGQLEPPRSWRLQGSSVKPNPSSEPKNLGKSIPRPCEREYVTYGLTIAPPALTISRPRFTIV